MKGWLAWSSLPCSEHTCSNYYGYVRVGCALSNQLFEVFDDSLFNRAELSVAKKGGFRRRAPMFLRLEVVWDMPALLVSEAHWVLMVMHCFALL